MHYVFRSMYGFQKADGDGFNTVASFQTARGAAISGGGNLWIVLAVGGKAHDVGPVDVLQFQQEVVVEVGVVCEDRTDAVLSKPSLQIRTGLGSRTEDGPHWRFNEQGAFIHTAYLTLNGQNMILCVDGCERVRIGHDCANAHNLILPVSFRVDDGEFTHGSLSLVAL